MAKVKVKLRQGTKYPFKHLDVIGSTFTVAEEKKNVTASYAMYKKKHVGFEATIIAMENGTVIVTRTA